MEPPLVQQYRAGSCVFGKIEEFKQSCCAGRGMRRGGFVLAQHKDGYCCGELEGRTYSGAYYVLPARCSARSNPARFPKSANCF